MFDAELLAESKLIRSKQMLGSYNAKDVADLIFLYFIVLTILKKDFNSATIAAGYAKHTMRTGNWDSWRYSYNDLALLIHTLFGKDNTASFLKDQEQNATFMKKVRFNEQEAKNWLRDVVRGLDRTNRDRRFLLNLERNLAIDDSNYRSMRRMSSEWTTLTHGERSLVVTRLLHAFRVRARKSELFRVLEAMAKANNLEIKNAKNPEVSSDQKDALFKSALSGSGIALGAMTLGAAHGAWKAAKAAEKRRAGYDKKMEEDLDLDEYDDVSESASSGASSAGAIASLPQGLSSGFISRQPITYDRFNKKAQNKTGGMGVAPDAVLQNGDKDRKKRKNEKKD